MLDDLGMDLHAARRDDLLLLAALEIEVAVGIQPADNAIAGDYVLNVSANGDGASDDQSFRVTVTTSTMWGAAGLGIIAAAVVVLAAAVTRYGRR